MPKPDDGVTIRIENLNICLGGTQSVGGPAAGGRKKFRGGSDLGRVPAVRLRKLYKLLQGFLSGGPTSTVPAGGATYPVQPGGTAGEGTIDASAFYQNGSGVTAVKAIVTQSETPPASGAVAGTLDSDGKTYRWTGLGTAKYSTTGEQNYLHVYECQGGDCDPVLTVPFTGVTQGSSGGGGGPGVACAELAAATALELTVCGGDLAGRHRLERVGRLGWLAAAGPLTGEVLVTHAGGKVRVRGPYGEVELPVTQERPFSLTVPGRLFRSAEDAEVTIA